MNIRHLMTRDAQEGAASKAVQRMAELAKKPQQRQASVGAVDIEARTVELSFSSELEYRRWFGIEILGHAPGEVRMDRLQDGAAVLWNHNWDDQRGVVESARIENGVGRAVIRLSKSAAGEQLLQDIADGIVSKVSVGYMVHGLKLIEEREDVDVFRVIDWEPFEISPVSVPADPTVGIGRSLENPPEEQPKETPDDATSINDSAATRATTEEQKLMKYRYFRDAQGNMCRVAQDENGKDVGASEIIEAAGADTHSRNMGADAERARTNAILALGDKFDARDLAAQMVRDNKSEKDMQDALLERFNQRTNKPLNEQNRTAEIGMSAEDVSRFSFLRAARALHPNATRADREAAAFEFECSENAQRATGKTAQGILIPADVLGATSRVFNAGGVPGTGQSGAHLVPHTVSTSWIDQLKNRSVMMRLATVMSGLIGSMDIPKKTDRAKAYWLGEGQDATETGMDFGQITITPKTVAAYIDITRKLLSQSSPDAEALVRKDLSDAVGEAIDIAAIYGTGTQYQPRGLKNYNGMNAVDFATAQKPTFAELVAMETEIAADNADIGSMAYLMHSRLRGWMKTTPKFGSGTETTIWEPGNTVNGYRTEVTNQVNAGDMFFGNFADFLIAMWGGLDMIVDTSSLSKSGGTRIVVFQDVDFALRRLESICYGSDTVS
ncbi:phage major capsid protein [Bradyrhizobium sp. BWC-3-1]|uniref:phage major capsid protein n=1 Tax=Bradyrhizobium sp. BWC-3-1 TaxID=3080012 RepID=UPI00293F5BFE|nr:phage major capsid protein [Bradyrhizobium sp. BWC-3-1]WOH61912.1 phage major capsid protein [Bradyrhizobium sp. BWC-3-1]